MLLAVASGNQAALMAPTEILAEQHFDSICALLARATEEGGNGKLVHNYPSLLPQPITVGLLIGSLRVFVLPCSMYWICILGGLLLVFLLGSLRIGRLI